MSSQKEQARALLKSIETGDTGPVGSISPNKYIQHNLGAADGLDGFGALMQLLPKGSAKVQTARVFQGLRCKAPWTLNIPTTWFFPMSSVDQITG